ncbi:Cwf15 / Cwc15 cell cycle control family protein [Prunus dulcis]|uniref:Cwf15 / Cwc15 cell cycle control family protein n=3 Tax=Prunus TaxID=3754 RepID=A0A4Y1RJZ8_PRUDU|nr:Cwf15 / Cwc15 cell cycle control family protein [Prunus dulcis]
MEKCSTEPKRNANCWLHSLVESNRRTKLNKDVEGASTQWDDIQRKLGNLPAKPPAFKPAPFTPAEDEASLPKDKSWIDEKTEQDLEDLEDNPISTMIASLKITGSDFVREVSQAPADVWVVAVLYKEGIAECGVLMQCLEDLATKYPATKFVKIISTDCIPNYPDRNVPTVLVYNNGAVKANYVGLQSFGRRCTPEGVALVLCQSDPVLNDGQSGNDRSRKAVIDGVRKRFIEKVVTEHENDDDGSSRFSINTCGQLELISPMGQPCTQTEPKQDEDSFEKLYFLIYERSTNCFPARKQKTKNKVQIANVSLCSNQIEEQIQEDMTTAARPTWAPAKGGNEQGGTRIFGPSQKYSSRDMAAHTTLKPRKEGQDTQDELQKKNLREELEERERKHYSSKDKSYSYDRDRRRGSQLLLEGGRRDTEIVPRNVDADDSDVEVKSDDESSEDDDDDDEEALMAELEQIRKEKAEEKLRKERQEREEELKVKEAELLRGNPLLNGATATSFSVKRRWDDDVVFKNQARGETKAPKRFINDTVRNDFHRKFLHKYMKSTEAIRNSKL